MANYYLDDNGKLTKKKKNQGTNYVMDDNGNLTSDKEEEEIAPVKESSDKDERRWFEKGAFEDGYQFGDVFKTIWGSSMDLGENVTAGILGIGEAVVDAGAYVAGGTAKLFGNDEFADKTKDFIAKDLYDERALARKILQPQQPLSYAWADPDEDSVLGEKTDAVAQSAGQLLGTAGLQMAGVPWWLTTGVTSFGGATEEAFKEDATYGEAGGSALISAGAEILTEKLSGGISFGGKTLDDVLLQPLVNKISSKVGRTLVNLGLDAVGEGTEEVISSVFSRLGSALYKEESLEELLTSEEAMDEYLESFIGGAALGGGMGGFNASNAIANGTDYKTGLTESERKVIDKEIENRISEQQKDGRRLTGKEKAAIEQAVKADMERGYLSTDTIESVLGGESYQAQQTYAQEAETLKTEIEQIEARLEGGVDATEQQTLRDRLKQARAELKEHTDGIGEYKSNTSKFVTDALMGERRGKGSMLVESYNERARRGQAFEADMDKYTTKEQAVIKKAIDSGILNNTNRTHDFVDMIAKISAERGVLFDFTNNAKLKESGFAVEGKSVNGFVTKDGVTVNIDSAKSLNSVVGHEITHVLEGTELYSELQKAVMKYAEAKGELATRKNSLTQLYKGIKDANVDAELTADLVGDYLFTDADFIKNLSVEHRNVFQKIYDEVKYLLKVATAGSKEARELERVKRAFDKAYKEGGKAAKDTKYSLTEIESYSDLTGESVFRSGWLNANQRMVDAVVKDRAKTQTPQFKAWFDNSKAETKNGEPLLVFHGTHSTFGTFKPEGKVIWFSTNPMYAQQYSDAVKFADKLQPASKVYGGANDKVIPAYIRALNPADFGNTDGAFKDVVHALSERLRIDESKLLGVWENSGRKEKTWQVLHSAGMVDLLRRHGYDSVTATENGCVTWGVFDSKQVKSAVSNNGSFNAENPDIRYSLSDSDGRQLSAEQQEYFADSKVRDENGNLKVMYHGTSKGGHTVFDTFGSNYGLFGQGSYFTDNKGVAETYTKKGKGNAPQVYEAYLNITNPMDMDAQADAEAWRKAFPDAAFPDGGTNEDFYRAMEEYFQDEEYSKWEAAEIAMDGLMGMGYDGITHIGGGRVNADGARHQVYIAFHPEQIKNIDNAKPTENPDIRYSLSGDMWSQIREMQLEVNSLEKSISEFEASEEYKSQMRKITEAIDSGNVSEGVAAYQKWLDESGLGELQNKRNALNDELKKLRKDAEEARITEALDEERKAIEKSGLSEADYFRKQAVKEFGYTPYFYDAGYIVPNGKMLNFSGEKGKHFGSRGQDHRAIGTIYADTDGTAALNRFVNDGNIRIVPESPGFDVSATVEPTKEQYATIRRFIYESANKGYFSIDISDKDGRVVGSLEYENRINPTRIIADLKHYYETGEIRQPSSLEGFRYSLSEDTEGRKLSPATAKRFSNSKAVDENGKLKVLYHGTATGEFSTFDKSKGSVEGDFGSGFYFTDNETDVAENYEGGGPDFDNKVARLAERIEAEEEIDYDEAKEKAREQLFKGSHKFEVYLNIENPAIVGETILLDGESYLEEYDEADYEDYDDYIGDVEQLVADDIDKILWEVEQNVDFIDFGDGFNRIKNVLWEAYYDGGIGIEELKSKINELYLDDDVGQMVGNEITRQIIESLGYDGIIDPTVSTKWNMNMEAGTTHYIVFKPNQIKAVTNENPTDNPDIHKSLSREGEQFAPIGNYNVYGSDVALQKPSAKATETVAPIEQTVDNAVDNTVADDYAPLAEEDASALQSEAIDSITDADAPPEMDAPYYGDNDGVVADNPFEARDLKEVGNRKVKAYMYENPEVKPFFQAEANVMLGELRDTVKGEKWFDDQTYYETNGEAGWGGTSRHTTADIAYLLDEGRGNGKGYTYAEIEQGLKDIIEDHGEENNACSKRIEFLLNDRLMKGYQAIDGFEIPANQDYVKLISEKQITEYNEENFKSLFADAPQEDIAPVAAESEVAATKEPVAPARAQASEAIKPKPTPGPRMARATAEEQLRLPEDIAPTYESTSEGQVPGQRRMFAEGHTAEVLEGEPPTVKKDSRIWTKFRNNFLDKQSVFEDLALKTNNRELMGKANYMLSSESRAQWMIGHGANGVKSLNDIRSEVEKTGLTKQFAKYLYHVHNIDRMTLDVRFGTDNKAVFGDSVTAEVSRDEVKKLEAQYPQFKSFANDVYAYNKHLRQQMVKSDVISQETAALWDKMYPHYVPIRRVGESGLGVNVPLDSRKTGVNAPIKRATGGSSDILPLFDTMAMRTEQTYKAIAKNRFGVELKNTLGTTVETAKASLDEIIEGVDTHEELLQKGKNGANPTFTVFENGKRVKFEISEDMYDALRPTAEGLKTTIKPLSVASSIQRGILTEYNPVFMLTNAVKDAQDILINSQHPVKTYAKLPAAFTELATKGKWYNEYMANGGEQNTYFDGQSNTFTQADKGIKKIVGMPLRAISAVNNFFERAPRLAEYMASREAGASAEVAMLDAARVTTNFQAGGDVTKWANRNGFTFLNASVQGFNQQVRNVREAKANGLKGWAQLAAKVAVAGLPAMLLNNLLWDDDEEYEELSDYVKENYYVVAKYGDGKFVRIPKGRTMAVIQNAFEQIHNARTGDDEVDLNSFLELVVSNLAPNNPLDNNVIAPILQAYNNETWYGEALVPQRLQDLPAAEQYDESTDEISKWLGEKLNVSPYKLNYLLNQYSGGVGDVVLPHLTPEAERGESSILAPFSDKFTTDSVMNNQNVSDFYDTMDTLTANAKSVHATDEDVLKYKYFNTVNADLSELYQQKREVQSSDLSDAEKYSQMREIQEQINALAKNSLATYGNVNIDGSYASIGDEHFHLNDKGEWTKVTDKQLQKQEEVTGGLGISASDYWSNKEEYDYAYENPERYAVSQAVGSYDAWKTYSSELYDIKADKDEDGKSISGSRKEKVIAWINEQDMDYGAKLVLFKSEYPADDTYNADIVEYLNGREDITYEQMVTILKELGFKVNGNRVTWD